MISPQAAAERRSQLGPSRLPFVLPVAGGATPLSLHCIFQGFRRFGVGGLAIIRHFFIQFVPKRMTRDEMLDLARQLVKAAGETNDRPRSAEAWLREGE